MELGWLGPSPVQFFAAGRLKAPSPLSALQPPSIVDFQAPPVVEVVCGVQFGPLPALHAVHLGLFWERVREAFPETRDAPPLPTVLERTDNGGEAVGLQEAFAGFPILPRAVFIDRSGKELLQLQNGRYHHNWQRLHGNNRYKRYAAIRPAFLQGWEAFQRFISEERLGALHPVQYELSYVNHVPEGELWNDQQGVGTVLPWFAPKNDVVGNTFEPEFALHSPFPACRGRLHVTGRIGVRPNDRVRVLVVELLVRGAPAAQDATDLPAWMDSARGCIVRSFLELTSDKARKHWGQVT